MIYLLSILFGLFVYNYLKNKENSRIKEFDKIDKSFFEIERVANDGNVYKARTYREFEIKALSHRSEDVLMRSLSFVGIAKCVLNPHDKYAVGIFNGNNELVGYVPRGNKKLFNSIQEWHEGKVMCWGGIDFNDFYNKFKYRFSNAHVSIPVGFTEEELNKITYYFSKEKRRRLIQSKHSNKQLSIDEGFELFDLCYEIEEIRKTLKGDYFEPYRPTPMVSLITSLSKKLEEEKNWEGLIRFSKYEEEINLLSSRFKDAALRRIEKAYMELNKSPK